MTREPVVAGQFYPGDAAALRNEIRSYLQSSDSALLQAKCLIAPHAGYVYSGGVAGAAYASVQLPSRMILMGPNHTGRGAALSLYPEGDWRTPLGTVRIDADLSSRLQAECPGLKPDRGAHAYEHSLEVQLPFIQMLVERFEFCAICVGTYDLAALKTLGHALARVIRSSAEPVLIVCSSDMNHYESAKVAELKDRMAIEKIQQLDPDGLHRVVLEQDISMCGFAPAVSALAACKDLGASEARLIRHATSGDVNGDYTRVVGYAALAIL